MNQIKEIHQPDRKFKSVTTPGKTFYMIESIAEFVCLQKFGIDIGPKFWYKSANKPKARKCFINAKSKMYAILKKKPNIKALDLLGITLERYNDKKKKKRKVCHEKTEETEIETTTENLIELKSKNKKTIFGENNG